MTGFDGPIDIFDDAIDHVYGLTSDQRETAKELARTEGTAVAQRYVRMVTDDPDDEPDGLLSPVLRLRDWIGKRVD